MRDSKSSDKKACHGSQSRSALDDGMDRECKELDREKTVSLKLSSRQKFAKVVRRRFIPVKDEIPAAASVSSHYPWIKKHARPLSKPLS